MGGVKKMLTSVGGDALVEDAGGGASTKEGVLKSDALVAVAGFEGGIVVALSLLLLLLVFSVACPFVFISANTAPSRLRGANPRVPPPPPVPALVLLTMAPHDGQMTGCGV